MTAPEISAPESVGPLAATLSQIPLLQEFDDPDLRELATLGSCQSFDENRTVFSEGDISRVIYFILSGSVQIHRRGEGGERLVLSVLTQGAFFGFARGAVSATTMEASQLYVLEPGAFFEFLAQSPERLAAVFSILTKSIHAGSERYFRPELAARTLQSETEKQRHQSLAQIVAGVAHEINTPLGMITTAASVIEREVASEAMTRAAAADPALESAVADIREATDLMTTNITKAARLIRSFKSLSIDELVGRKEMLDLNEAVLSAINLYRLSARQAQIAIEVVDNLGPSRMWQGYEGCLSHILLNLLTNIRRYAYPDGSPGRVEIVLATGNEHGAPQFILSVRDFGRGIAPEHLPRVFEAFYTTGRGSGGTGLGLAIVHGLATKALKGAVALTSALGQGTTVTITFPQRVRGGAEFTITSGFGAVHGRR